MPSIVIIYHSASGTTAQLAEAIFAAAKELATPSIYRISGTEIIAGRFIDEAIWAQLDQADAIIFGSPTYMRGPSAQFLPCSAPKLQPTQPRMKRQQTLVTYGRSLNLWALLGNKIVFTSATTPSAH